MKKSIGYPKTKALLEWFGENPRQISAHKPLNPLWFHRFTNDRKYDPSTGLLDTERAARYRAGRLQEPLRRPRHLSHFHLGKIPELPLTPGKF